MTLHLLDVSRWQTGLNLQAARDEGFQLVNVQLTGQDGYVFPGARAAVEQARALGMGTGVYHWLDGRLPGRVQAEQTWQRIQAVGGPQGLAVQVDCEDTKNPATWLIWRDYVTVMQDLLGRPVVNYTGDWWWDGRAWPGASVTPYLWAPPRDGYPGVYPGDTSGAWNAGYGGWDELAVMQYAVRDVAGVRCSLSAVRFHSLWATLTGGDPVAWRVARGLDKLLAQINAMAPARSKASDGSIGDVGHCPPGYDRTNPPSQHCADDRGVVRARDFTHDPGRGANMHEVAERLRQSRDRRIRYVIWNRRQFSPKSGWQWIGYDGSNPHDKHMHVSTVDSNAVADDTSEWEINVAVTDADVNTIFGAGWEIPGRTPGRTAAGTLEALLDRTATMGTKLDQLQAAAATDETRDIAHAAALQAIADQIAAGGGSVDVAAIQAHIDLKTGETNTAVEAMRQAHQAEIDQLQAENAALREQIAAVPDAVIAEIAD